MSVVAIFNSSEDTVEMLRVTLEDAGFETVAGHVPAIQRGHLDLVRFLREHDPAAVVYDISLPYAENWNFLHLVRDSAAMRNRGLVLTTTHERALEELVGPTGAIEIVGKPYEPAQIVDAVRRAIGEEGQRGAA